LKDVSLVVYLAVVLVGGKDVLKLACWEVKDL
jgi:hypothetical protein